MDEICIMVEIDNGNQHIDSVSKIILFTRFTH